MAVGDVAEHTRRCTNTARILCWTTTWRCCPAIPARCPARALIGFLLLHRTLPVQAVLAGLSAAAGFDSIDPDLVAVEARRAAHPQSIAPRAVPISTVEASRPAPSLTGYDQLLAGEASCPRRCPG